MIVSQETSALARSTSPAASARLPRFLIKYLILLSVSSLYLVLIQQPPGYWMDFKRAVSYFVWTRALLESHPLLFIGFSLMLVLVIGGALRKLSRAAALVLWLISSYLYSLVLARAVDTILARAWPALGDWHGYYVILGLLALFTASLLARYVRTGAGLALDGPVTRRPEMRRRVMLGVCGAWFLVLNTLLAFSVVIPAFGWHPVRLRRAPSERYAPKMAYNTRQSVAIMFGGESSDEEPFNDTWEWDGTTWRQHFPPESPPPRSSFAMAYDAHRDRVVLFGGRNGDDDFRDTWEWDGAAWLERQPAWSPQARCCHSMVYDEQRQKVLLYGGYYGDAMFLTDAWEWDGETWHLIDLGEATGPTISAHSLTCHAGMEALVIVGTPTWVWQDVGWTQLQMDIAPVSRQYDGVAYDPSADQIVLFGGRLDERSSNDTWVFDGQTWRALELPMSPTPRWGHSMFYDQVRKRVMVFGGWGDTAPLNDMWELVLP